MFALTGLRNFSESTIDYVYKKENKETIIKKKERRRKGPWPWWTLGLVDTAEIRFVTSQHPVSGI